MNLTQWNSEYWFVAPGTEPVEIEISGDGWDLRSSKISSYDQKIWYIAPVGLGITRMTGAFLDYCLMSIYCKLLTPDREWFLVLYQLPESCDTLPPNKTEDDANYTGGESIPTPKTHKTRSILNVTGEVVYADLTDWDHPIDHRKWIGWILEMIDDVDTVGNLQVIWHEGVFIDATIMRFEPRMPTSEDFEVSSRLYDLTIEGDTFMEW